MSLSLLDTNVWVSLAIDRHEHHLLALDWFDKASGDASACFCRMTQNSFLRLLTLKAIFEEDTRPKPTLRVLLPYLPHACISVSSRTGGSQRAGLIEFYCRFAGGAAIVVNQRYGPKILLGTGRNKKGSVNNS